jgi:type IV pilus assembly protein PilE
MRTRSKTSGSGFTLIELMIVVAVVAILVAIAYPSYLNQMRKSNRAEAMSYLMDLANRNQQYLIDARSYACSEAALNISTPAAVVKFYTISFPTGSPYACNDTQFTVRGTPKSGTIQEVDYTLEISQDGTKKATDSGGSAVSGIW